MNRILTGAVAAAAGIALLLGGAGTFALWNTSASSAATAVNAGTLSLTADDDAVWTDITNGRSETIDPTTTLMVPGNTYRFTQTLTVTATGRDLRANLTYDPQSITADPAFLAATTQDLQVTSSSDSIVPSTSSSNTFVVSPSDGTSKVQVAFTLTFPSDATTGQGGRLSGSLVFQLTQIPIGA